MKKVIPSRRHEAAIPAHAQRKGFARALASHCSVYLGKQRIVPDGFYVETDRKRITIYEVVVTHDIHKEKLETIRILRSLLRDLGWMLRPMVGSAYGDFYPMDMRNGSAVISRREIRRAVNSINHSRAP